MSSTERRLCLMGSGETAPAMAPVHADLMSRVDSPPGLAVMLDTPYGFQENADEISARARTYFHANVGHPMEVVSLRDGTPRIRSRSSASTTSSVRPATSSPVPAAPRMHLGNGADRSSPS